MSHQTSAVLAVSPGQPLSRLVRKFARNVRLIIAVVVAIGVVLRLAAWVHNWSFWVDEIYLALNITGRSIAELWKPLQYDQGAPIGFLMLVKFVTVVFGTSELALRIVPLLAGLASLFVFPRVAARFLPPSGVLFATALFACSPKLIHYSSELKQYSFDVLVTLLLLDLAARRFRSPLKAMPLARSALVGAVAVWFSHPALFVLAGSGVVLAWDAWRRSDRRELSRLIAVGGVWLASLASCYLSCLRELSKNQYLLNYWSEFFAPLPPRNFEQAGWYLRAVSWIFDGPAGMSVADVSLGVPAALMFATGIWWLARKSVGRAGLLVAPLAMALTASMLHRYPFGGRLLLFAVPLLHLGVAAGWVALRSTFGGPASAFGLATGLAVLLAPAATALQQAVRPTIAEDNRAAIRYIADQWQDGDCIYLSSMAAPPMRYYGKRLGIDTLEIHGGTPRDNWDSARFTLHELAGRSRVWVFVTHERDANHKFLLWQLDQLGHQEAKFTAPGSVAYLYDLSRSATP